MSWPTSWWSAAGLTARIAGSITSAKHTLTIAAIENPAADRAVVEGSLQCLPQFSRQMQGLLLVEGKTLSRSTTRPMKRTSNTSKDPSAQGRD